MEPIVITPPAQLFSFEELTSEAHMNVIEDEAYGNIAIKSATKYYEQATGLVLKTQTRMQPFNSFCRTLLLKDLPIQDVVSVTYIDADGEEQELDYGTETNINYYSAPVRITVFTTPILSSRIRPVLFVTYIAGKDEPDEIDVLAVRMLAQHFFENRSATTDTPVGELPLSFQNIVNMRNTNLWGF